MPVFLYIPSQYSENLVKIVVRHVVNSSDSGFVVHLFKAAMNLLLYGFLCSLGSQYKDGNSSIIGGTTIFLLAI